MKYSCDFLDIITSGEKDTTTWNGALSNSSTGDELVNQFGIAGSQRDRDIKEVFNDQQKLWYYDKVLSLKFVFYLRMITRNVKYEVKVLPKIKTNNEASLIKILSEFENDPDKIYYSNEQKLTSKVQRGQGNKDESLKRLLWYAVNEPDIFYSNLYLLPLVGSWKDIIKISFIAHQNNIELNYKKIFDLIYLGLLSDNQTDLVKKYLPRIQQAKKCTTEWTKFSNKFARDFAKSHEWTDVQYRKMKSMGTAHDFQKLICGQRYKFLNYDLIPGKALSLLANGKFFKNHDLVDVFTKWIKSKPSVKFNGYPYDLGKLVSHNLPLYKKYTIDKQFEFLLETAKRDTNSGLLSKKNVICAIDRSSSMLEVLPDVNTTCMNVAESLGIFFASLIEGAFHNYVIVFSERSKWRQLKGDSFVHRKLSFDWDDCPSNTNFISVLKSFVNVKKKHPEIPLEQFPNVLLIVSDMQFDKPTFRTEAPNYEVAKHMLYEVFPKEWVDDFVFIWWQVNGTAKDYPARIDNGGCYVVSGFDGSIITTLLGGISKTNENGESVKPDMLEMVKNILDQEILNLITI